MIVQSGGLNDTLDLPGRNAPLPGMLPPIKFQEFHFAVAHILPAQSNHIVVLSGSIFPASASARSTRFIFQTSQEIFFEPSLPLVEGFAGDTEMPGSERNVFFVFLPEDDPFQTTTGGAGELEQFRQFSPTVVPLK